MAAWRVHLFQLLERRERPTAELYGIPPDRVVDVDIDVEP